MVMSPGCDSFITTSSATGANFRFIERKGGIIGLNRVELISHAFYSPRLLEENTVQAQIQKIFPGGGVQLWRITVEVHKYEK